MSWVRATAAVAASASAMLLLAACAAPPDEPPPFPEPPPQAQAPPPMVEPTTRGGVQTAIYRWFVNAGYPPFQALALMDHARIESGFNPCIAGPGGLRYTYQWGGARLQRLHEFAGTRTCRRSPRNWPLPMPNCAATGISPVSSAPRPGRRQ